MRTDIAILIIAASLITSVNGGCLNGDWCGTVNCSDTLYSFSLMMTSTPPGTLKFWNDGGETDEFEVLGLCDADKNFMIVKSNTITSDLNLFTTTGVEGMVSEGTMMMGQVIPTTGSCWIHGGKNGIFEKEHTPDVITGCAASSDKTGCHKAYDGNPKSVWVPKDAQATPWIKINFNAAIPMKGIKLKRFKYNAIVKLKISVNGGTPFSEYSWSHKEGPKMFMFPSAQAVTSLKIQVTKKRKGYKTVGLNNIRFFYDVDLVCGELNPNVTIPTNLTDISGIHFGMIEDCTESHRGPYFYQLEITELQGNIQGSLRVATVQDHTQVTVSGTIDPLTNEFMLNVDNVEQQNLPEIDIQKIQGTFDTDSGTTVLTLEVASGDCTESNMMPTCGEYTYLMWHLLHNPTCDRSSHYDANTICDKAFDGISNSAWKPGSGGNFIADTGEWVELSTTKAFDITGFSIKGIHNAELKNVTVSFNEGAYNHTVVLNDVPLVLHPFSLTFDDMTSARVTVDDVIATTAKGYGFKQVLFHVDWPLTKCP